MNEYIHKGCEDGNKKPIYPVTSLTFIKDLSTGKTLDEYLQSINHIYLPFKGNSKTETRLQVPQKFRRKGLWISYESCKGNVITEWYNSKDFTNKSWGNNNNWVPYMDESLITEIINEANGWYKA